MPAPELHNYLCAYDFEVEDKDFLWEEDGESFSEWLPCRIEIGTSDPETCRVVIVSGNAGEITLRGTDVEITYSAYPSEE